MNKQDKHNLRTTASVQTEYVTKLKEILTSSYDPTDPNLVDALELLELIETNTEVTHLILGVET
tara:strand:+ start:2590 stop:2781 length:192 start_codon:yes stop_codon:yes gene_type:complete